MDGLCAQYTEMQGNRLSSYLTYRCLRYGGNYCPNRLGVVDREVYFVIFQKGSPPSRKIALVRGSSTSQRTRDEPLVLEIRIGGATTGCLT